MKKIIIALAMSACTAAACLTSCNNEELQRLQAQNDSLRSVATTGGVKIDEYFAAFNAIQENLAQIKEKENIISVKTGTGQELDQTSAEQINEDILSIYDLLLKNKQTIKDLNKKLQQNGLKNSEMAKTIKLLEKQVADKDNEINSLKGQLEKLNFDVKQLNEQVEELTENLEQQQQENEQKTQLINEQDEALNTVYYVYGTKKELMNHKVISREGAFKGLKIGDSFDKDYFTKVDMRAVNKITLNSKKDIQILSSHPSGSYKTVTNGKTVESIEINDPEKFWERSKFLVVLIKE